MGAMAGGGWPLSLARRPVPHVLSVQADRLRHNAPITGVHVPTLCSVLFGQGTTSIQQLFLASGSEM